MSDVTLRRYLTERALDPNLIFLLEDIASSCRVITNCVRNGAFENNHGNADAINVQGETQKTLNFLANDEFERICSNSPRLAALVSEEVEAVTWLKDPEAGDYLLYFDPLDGSSNLDVNLSVGSIFAAMKVQADADRNALHTNLVMHGSSSVPQELQDIINDYGGNIAPTGGVSVDEIERGIKYGVRKVNIDTDLRMALTGAIRKVFNTNPSEFDPRKYLAPGVDAMAAVCKDRFERFGSAGTAGEIVPVPLAKRENRYVSPHMALVS